MATDKKGFILYADQKELFDQLPNDKAGELIKHIFSYVNDENPVTEDLLIKLAFTPIKQQLKRDLQKFEEVKLKRSEAGKKSAEARANKAQQSSTNSTSVKSVQQDSTNPTVNDTVNVNDNVKDNVILLKAFKSEDEFIEKFNIAKEALTGIKGRTKILSKTDKNNFKNLNKAYSLKDFRHALTMMGKSEWVKQNKMFTTAHFLVNDNFNKYLNQTDTLPMAQGLREGN